MQAVLGLASVAGPVLSGTVPPVNVTLCEVESCLVSPTGCSARAECQGCGPLCFGSDPLDPGYDLYLNSTGLGMQAGATEVWDGILAGGGGGGPQCGVKSAGDCYRGSGDNTLVRWAEGSEEASSAAACCKACTQTKGCVAWQLVTKAGKSGPECSAMATMKVKSDSADTCVSAALPTGHAPLDGLLRSADIVLGWQHLQPQPPPAPYEWSELSGAVDRAYANGGRLIMMLWAGTKNTPVWVYDLGVEKVAENSDGAVPNYLNPKYQDLVRAVHSDLAAFLRSKAPANKAFMALQPCLGATGDDTPFHPGSYNVLNKTLETEIRAAWTQYYRNMSLFLQKDAFAQEIDAKQMVLLLNGETSFPDGWVRENLPGSFRKHGRLTHTFNENSERYSIAQKVPTMFELQDGRPVRARGELSAETCWTSHNSKHGKPICDPPQKQPWGFYAMTNFVTSAHVDFWNVQPNAAAGIFNDTQWAPMWRLLNRYAGARWPRQSPGGWIAFRDGLDAMDTERFGKFGTLVVKDNWWLDEEKPYPRIKTDQSNVELAKAICEDNKARGCKIEDEDALLDDQRHALGINDVAFGNWRGDYGGFLRLTNPEATRGWWRVGSEKEEYGRYARSFADPSNASAHFLLSLDRGLWGGLPLTAAKRLAVRVLFFDDGVGQFQIHYDALSGETPTLIKVKKTNTKTWKEACAEVTDGRFDGRGPGGSDICIQNADQEDDIFGGLEIAEESLDDISLKGCDFQAASALV